MNLPDIALRVESPVPARLLGGIRPLLREIEARLAALVATGQGGSIDLRSLPLSPAEAAELDAALGSGEVRATVASFGETTVRETALHGVWRVTHRDEAGNVVGDFIEVCQVPDILKTHAADAHAALAALRDRIAAGPERA